VTELTIDQALQQGIEAHKAGQVQEADRLYTAILKVQPKHPDANHNMGVLAVGVGKVEQALPFFKTPRLMSGYLIAEKQGLLCLIATVESQDHGPAPSILRPRVSDHGPLVLGRRFIGRGFCLPAPTEEADIA
jgi:hypothetical protein